jgi:valyl-tRNA synthetase
MIIKPGLRDFFWIVAGAVITLALVLVLMHFREDRSPAAQLASKANRAQLAGKMRLSLALASEAANNAVMATTDRDSRNFADQAREATKLVEQNRQELTELLQNSGAKSEKELLAKFSQTFTELQRIDKDLLNLAVRNTNIKAYSLAFGPAEEVFKKIDTELARIAEKSAGSSKDSCRVQQMANEIRIGILRILTQLPPHIAEESDHKMDNLESLMEREDKNIRKSLEELTGLLKSNGDSGDMEAVKASYDKFGKIKAQIIKLSRENTNVRSLAISLNEKRKVMLVAQDSLASLLQAIENEPVYSVPVNPR